MFRQLENEIRERQRRLTENRRALVAQARAFETELRRKLATPAALGIAFGAGVVAALCLPRQHPVETEAAETGAERPGSGAAPRLGGWLLRELLVPVLLGLLAQARASEDGNSPQSGDDSGQA